MKTPHALTLKIAAAAVAASLAVPAHAADELNVAYFLEWATPNMIAKAEARYEAALGVPVNWIAFEAGTAMTEAMLAGDIDISYSQGLAPFITAVNADAPIKMIGLAVEYSANPCVVAAGAGIDASNASELEGKTVAVPLATMADYSFRMQLRALDVDIDQVTVVDQVPADAVNSLADGSVDMACLFGGNSIASALENGEQLMSNEAMQDAGIVSFDVVSVTEDFAQREPEMVQAFMTVTDEANQEFGADQSKLSIIAGQSGMDEETTVGQMADFKFPTLAEQADTYFSAGGLANIAVGVVGGAFATADKPAKSDYSSVIDTSFLK